MVSDVIRQRFGRLFRILDRNGDGFVDGTDYELVVTSLAERRNLEPGSPDHVAIQTKVMDLWEGLREVGDADGDGRITQEEYVESMAALAASPEGFDRTGRPSPIR